MRGERYHENPPLLQDAGPIVAFIVVALVSLAWYLAHSLYLLAHRHGQDHAAQEHHPPGPIADRGYTGSATPYSYGHLRWQGRPRFLSRPPAPYSSRRQAQRPTSTQSRQD